MFTSLHLPDWSSVKSWLLCMQSIYVTTTPVMTPPDPVVHLCFPISIDVVANDRLG